MMKVYATLSERDGRPAHLLTVGHRQERSLPLLRSIRQKVFCGPVIPVLVGCHFEKAVRPSRRVFTSQNEYLGDHAHAPVPQ